MNVLIVEDEAYSRRDLIEIVVALGHNVVGAAQTAYEGLGVARVAAPEVALLDIRLAGEHDGLWLARMLREELDLAIIFVTAFADPPTIARAKALRPDGYLVKPFTPDSVFAAIEIAAGHAAEARPTLDASEMVSANECEGSLSRAVLARIDGHLERRFNKAVRVDELATLAGLTASHFIVQYKRATGVTPYQRLIALRMEEAKRLLLTSEMALDAVAEHVGYESVSHFAALFKREVGVTPGQFRKSL